MAKDIFDLYNNKNSIIDDVFNSLLKSAFKKKYDYLNTQIEISKKEVEILKGIKELQEIDDVGKKYLKLMDIEDNKDDIEELKSKFGNLHYDDIDIDTEE